MRKIRYLITAFRVFVIVAVVLAVGNFSGIKKTKAAAPTPPAGATCNATPVGGIYNCVITGTATDSNFVLPISTSPNSLDGTNLTISKNIVSGQSPWVVSTGAHNFNNVTMKDNTQVTTLDLASTSSSMNDEPEKIIDWTIEGTLSLSDNALINARYKGYWGAVSPNAASGPAFGQNISLPNTVTNCAGGGGGLGGNGQNGLGQGSPTVALGGVRLNIETLERGSGGGSATCGNPLITRSGHTGGGVIKIWAKEKIILSGAGVGIDARGRSSGATTVNGGGGAGGSIWLKTKTFSSDNIDPSKVGPVVTGGKRGTDTAPSGITNVAPNMAYFNINASGGSSSLYGYGGGGGGGIVKIYTETTEVDCHITKGTNIPSICEGKDVIIDGSAWVDLTPGDNPYDDNLTIYTTNSLQHHFTSLKITNNAILTHESLNFPGDFDPNDSAHGNPLTSFGQGKKVDLLIDGDLILENGGKIDVSGKGYPGGNVGSDASYDGYGIGRGQHFTHVTDHQDKTSAGGAGFGGRGGDGSSFNGCTHHCGATTPPAVGGIVYPYLNSTFGSGGGGAYTRDTDGGGMASVGGDGGGRVYIKSNKIIFKSSNSIISANGESRQSTGGDEVFAIGGRGSGGFISILTNDLQYSGFVPSASATANRGTDHNSGTEPKIKLSENGQIINSSGKTLYNMSANGGSIIHPTWGTGSGGGGRIIIGLVTLTATLTAVPSTSATGSLPTTLTANAGGTASDPTLNYNFWWDCDHPETTTYTATVAVCGDPHTASIGAKFDTVPAAQNPKSTTHTYTTGTYHPKVVIERNSLAAQAMTATPITVTSPVPVIQSKKIEVTVSWKEGTVTKTVKLYDILRSVIP